MIVAVHFPSMHEAPAGVWWEQNGVLRRYYTDRILETVGLSTMLALVEDADVEAWFQRLADRVPYSDAWEVADLGPAMTPREYLELVQLQAGKLLLT